MSENIKRKNLLDGLSIILQARKEEISERRKAWGILRDVVKEHGKVAYFPSNYAKERIENETSKEKKSQLKASFLEEESFTIQYDRTDHDDDKPNNMGVITDVEVETIDKNDILVITIENCFSSKRIRLTEDDVSDLPTVYNFVLQYIDSTGFDGWAIN